MLDFNFQNDTIVTSLTGKLLMNTPLLNKGTAFTAEERRAFGLLGKLPARVETLDEQVARAYEQYKRYTVDLSQHIYLYNLHERNEVLFYKLVSDHLEEMMPIIYTPIIGNAVKQYSREFRAPRGLYIAYPDRNDMDMMISNRTHPDIDLIVATDGSGVLGIGDQGIGGMDIPVAKLMVYTLCAGINPGKTLPVMLDVGTDNQTLLNDPLYLGWRHERLRGQEYDDFIDRFVKSVAKQFPHSFLHWEDFGRDAAHSVLERYKEEHSSFNDDIQGTGVVCLAAILAALKATKQTIADQRIVIYGAGAAGVGIADQIAAALIRSGMPEREARSKFWLLNSQGLIVEGKEVKSFQRPYMRTAAEVKAWGCSPEHVSLEEVVSHVKPTVLIGTSAAAGAFSEKIVKTMAQHVKRPIIMPLSNPTERAEANPRDLLHWTDGRVMVATGSPFQPVEINGKTRIIAQANNALAFPGLGLAILATRARILTDAMLWAACEALAELSPVLHDPDAALLAPITEAKEAAYQIALAVAQVAMDEGLARVTDKLSAAERVDSILWQPRYLPLIKA